MPKLVATVRISRPHYKRVPRANGFTSERDGTQHAQVSIYLDERLLAERLGWRAADNKSNKAKAQHGAVIIECDWHEVTP